MKFVDYYGVLGLPRFYPTSEEIKEAFLAKLVQLYDGANSADADQRQQLDIAFLTLQDTQKKRAYDEVLARHIEVEEQTPFGRIARPSDFFEHHYKRAYEVLKAYPSLFTPTALFELPIVMYVIAKFGAGLGDKDLEYVSSNILQWIWDMCLANMDLDQVRDVFIARSAFYGEIVRGRPLIGYCLFTTMPSETLTAQNIVPSFRCAVAFTDCILDNKCIEDYSTNHIPFASFLPLHLATMMETVVFPLAGIFNDLLIDISESPPKEYEY